MLHEHMSCSFKRCWCHSSVIENVHFLVFSETSLEEEMLPMSDCDQSVMKQPQVGLQALW